MYIENDSFKLPMIYNFTFQPPAFKDLAEASRKAEEHIMGDPRTAPPAPRLPRGTVMRFTDRFPVLP